MHEAELARLLEQAGDGARAVEDFWEAALAEAAGETAGVNALSYEQAQTLGLLPKDISK